MISCPSMPSPLMSPAIALTFGAVQRITLRPAQRLQLLGRVRRLRVDVVVGAELAGECLLRGPRDRATVRKPSRLAYWIARCPSPPMPWIATTSPPVAPLSLSALKVVAPAHSSGAASTDESSSGMRTSADVRATMYSA